MRLRIKKMNPAGFTFIEVLLATVLLGIGITGGLTLVQSSTLNSLDNESHVNANQLAHQKMESIIADKSFKGYASIISSNYPSETLASPYTGYTRTTTITEVQEADLTTPQTGSGFKKVDVKVSWGSATTQALSLSSVFANY